MGTINLSELVNILKTVMPYDDYLSPRVFLECKIFSEKNDKKISNTVDGSWTDLTDCNVISELTRATLSHHLSSPKLAYAVTKLIIYQYKGVLREIEGDISRDLKRLDEQSSEYVAQSIISLQKDGRLPLLNEYAIDKNNLAEAVVACVLHCFYIADTKLRKVGNTYAKGNIVVLNNSGVDQKQFEKDFPAYKFKLSWDELATTADCEYCNCDRCKHKCVKLDSNYNVEMLLKLYLNVKTEQNDDEEVDVADALVVLDEITDILSSEAKSDFIKTLIRKKLSMSDQLKYALDLMLQDKKNNDNNNGRC